MPAVDATRTAQLVSEALPYLKDLFSNAPQFGSAGLTFVFHDGAITRVDLAASVSRKPKGGTR
jgi:hypothetical protein